MDSSLYEMIFKRKSFHVYRNMGVLSFEELDKIQKFFKKLDALVPDIRTELKIVPIAETTMKRGEYALLLYSEKKPGYLENIGYTGAQLDLYLASENIGVCWYGAGKILCQDESSLEFVIMLSIAKVNESSFRKDMLKSRRKSISEIWKGSAFVDIANIVRFTPSACNVQPWYVEEDGNILTVNLVKSSGRRGIMPMARQEYYARIDIGIFICFLELCLNAHKLSFERRLYVAKEDDSGLQKVPVAEYIILNTGQNQEKQHFTL